MIVDYYLLFVIVILCFLGLIFFYVCFDRFYLGMGLVNSSLHLHVQIWSWLIALGSAILAS
jgi:hypothetical protein